MELLSWGYLGFKVQCLGSYWGNGKENGSYYLGFRFSTAPTQYQSILGVLFRAIYNHTIIIIQLLVRGAVPKGLGFRVEDLGLRV